MLKVETKQLIAVAEKQKAEELALAAFREKRQKELQKAVVITQCGNQYDADERSIVRMGNALLALINESDDHVTRWSMANTATGVMTETTKADLVEAHRLAVEFMSSKWERID